MSATIGQIAVAVVAKTKKFNRDMRKSGKTVGTFAGMVKKLAVGVAVAGAAIAAMGIAAVKSFASYGDAIAKMSKRTNVAVGELSELGFVAQIAGASMATVEKGIKRMSATIVDAADGLMESRRALERLGFTAEDLIQMRPADAFWELGRAVAAIEDPILQLAAAQEVFGRAGLSLLPMLKTSSEELDVLAARAKKLGLILSEDAAKDAETLTDAMLELKLIMPGVGASLLEGLGVNIDTLNDDIPDLAEHMRDLAKETGNWVADFISGAKEIIKWLDMTIPRLAPAPFQHQPVEFSDRFIARQRQLGASANTLPIPSLVGSAGPQPAALTGFLYQQQVKAQMEQLGKLKGFGGNLLGGAGVLIGAVKQAFAAPEAGGFRQAPGAHRVGSAGAAAFTAEQFYNTQRPEVQTAENTKGALDFLETIAGNSANAVTLAVASVRQF